MQQIKSTMSTIQSKIPDTQTSRKIWAPNQKKIRLTETDPEIAEIMELADNEAKTIIEQVCAEYVHWRKTWKLMNREVGNTHKKYQMEHIEIKNIISEKWLSLDEINSRLDNAEEKISELENITIKLSVVNVETTSFYLNVHVT